MKKFTFFYLAFCLIVANPAASQKSNFMNKVTKSANSILGKPDKAEAAKIEPEPSCASDQAILAMDLGGKLQLDYKELSISILGDGRILAQAHGSDEYYVAKDGVTTGPYKAGDPQIADFVPKDKDDGSEAAFLAKYKPYITKSGEKFLITFAGKKYGPYAHIDNFTVSKSKDKFAAIVTETVAMTEDQGKKMEEAMNNAKSDDERMQLAMEYAQQMQQNITQSGGGPESMQPKLVTNIPNTKYDFLKAGGGQLNGNIKYDDILIFSYDKIIDLQMKVIFTLKSEAIGAKDLFVNANNTKLAYYNSGTLNFSDNTTMTELFNPFLSKTDGKIYLNYMYYSPKHNAIMQHKILF
jgi:hypothetical protein